MTTEENGVDILEITSPAYYATVGEDMTIDNPKDRPTAQ